jgi:excinuclease ABC subunit C
MGTVKQTSGKKIIEELLSKANTLPKKPGCYFMKNKADEVIYVGKAKNLKSRVPSYFNNSQKSPKTQILVGHIRQFDFIITDSEAESFVLENNLIKKHRPKYNIRLKDDKSYPYLSVNFNHDFPRLEYVRRPKKKKGVELFGPYPTGTNIGSIIQVVTKAFALRDCSLHEFRTRKTACILYQMKQCSAPCVDKISQQRYKESLEMALNLFRGKIRANQSLNFLKELMLEKAQLEEFEHAAMLRDYIQEIENFLSTSYEQNVEFVDEKNVDIISYYQGESETDISLYLIRGGALLGHRNYNFLNQDMLSETQEEIVQYLLQYYTENDEIIPERIITSLDAEYSQLFENALEKIIGEQFKIKVETGTKKYHSLLNMTRKHAQETQRVRIENEESVYTGLHRLKDLLKLKQRPKTLEGYDVAIWQGKSPAASQVVFYEGAPDKKAYRYYHLAERPEGNNDFAMMREVFLRRLKYGNFPDVFVVDGGKAQVNTVVKVLQELDIDVPVVGIAKARDLSRGNYKAEEISKSEERLIIPGRSNPYILNKCPSLYRIIVQLRDEAHRFSRKLHHKAEEKRLFKGKNKKISKKN